MNIHFTEGRRTIFPTIYRATENNNSPKPVFDTDKQSAYFLTVLLANRSNQVKVHMFNTIEEKVTSTVNAKLSDTIEEYKKAVNDAVNDAVIKRLKSELMDIIINKGMSLSQLMANHTIKRATAQRDMKLLKDAEFITFIGVPKTGKYMITDKLSQIIKQ